MITGSFQSEVIACGFPRIRRRRKLPGFERVMHFKGGFLSFQVDGGSSLNKNGPSNICSLSLSADTMCKYRGNNSSFPLDHWKNWKGKEYWSSLPPIWRPLSKQKSDRDLTPRPGGSSGKTAKRQSEDLFSFLTGRTSKLFCSICWPPLHCYFTTALRKSERLVRTSKSVDNFPLASLSRSLARRSRLLLSDIITGQSIGCVNGGNFSKWRDPYLLLSLSLSLLSLSLSPSAARRQTSIKRYLYTSYLLTKRFCEARFERVTLGAGGPNNL